MWWIDDLRHTNESVDSASMSSKYMTLIAIVHFLSGPCVPRDNEKCQKVRLTGTGMTDRKESGRIVYE